MKVESLSEIGLREVAAGLGIQGGMGPICKAINLIEFPWKLLESGEIHLRALTNYFCTRDFFLRLILCQYNKEKADIYLVYRYVKLEKILNQA